jgi:hypothetical protein
MKIVNVKKVLNEEKGINKDVSEIAKAVTIDIVKTIRRDYKKIYNKIMASSEKEFHFPLDGLSIKRDNLSNWVGAT